MPSIEYVDPLYGTLTFTEPAAQVINHPALQRLKSIHQNGGIVLSNPAMDTTRFEHSLGVAHLCKHLGASDREVVAALLHDIGHTTFSHVADHVFDRADQAFHEEEVDRIVERYEVAEFLTDLGYDSDTILDVEGYPILEQPLPGLCADRLDYQLRDVYKYGLLDDATVEEILAGLTVEDGRPVAGDRETAHRLVNVSLVLQRQVFFDAQHEATNLILSELLETALEENVLMVDDLFGTDPEVLDTLQQHPEFAAALDALERGLSVRRESSVPTHTISRKRRTMDPHVAGTGQRISDCDPTVAHKLSRFRETVPVERGYVIELGQ